MKRFASVLLLIACSGASGWADQVLFQDDFKGHLSAGWSWVREHRDAWRVSERGLEVRVEPGNEWGPANNSKNLLLRAVPEAANLELRAQVTFESHSTEQYEQSDLTWFYDESNMVKIGRERVDGKPCIVMGREENDRTQTIKIIPLEAGSVQLSLSVKGHQISGWYRKSEAEAWQVAGECDLPKPADHQPARVCLQFYQGPANAEHWVRVSGFRLSQISD